MDLARFIEAVGAPDPNDPETRDAPAIAPGALVRALGRGAKGVIVGVDEREWRDAPSQKGYAVAFEAAGAFINSQLPQNEPVGQAFSSEVRMYPEKAIRELVANALIHQDFTITGAGPMVEIFADRMEITNPGEPLVDTLRFIDTPPRSRNEDLAALMRRMRSSPPRPRPLMPRSMIAT